MEIRFFQSISFIFGTSIHCTHKISFFVKKKILNFKVFVFVINLYQYVICQFRIKKPFIKVNLILPKPKLFRLTVLTSVLFDHFADTHLLRTQTLLHVGTVVCIELTCL